ncbi:MAG TPA: hypothetical protein VIH89_10995 [Candidatus Sulfotelmatobacter sp.]
MSTQSKKSLWWTLVLVLLGLAALIGGVKTLVLLLPAAWFAWHAARPILHSGRN